jgi:transcriptional regulator with XRE-family HTH domain
MRYSAQIRAARALLGWSQEQLASAAGIGWATLRRIEQEQGIIKGNFSTILKIQKALEQAGIQFTEDVSGEIGVSVRKMPVAPLARQPGARLRKPNPAKRK